MPKSNSKWEPEPIKTYAKKFVGLATVVTGEKKAKFTLTEEGKKFENGQTSITVLLEDLPDFPTLTPNDKSGKEYRIRLNKDGDEIEAIMPVRGHFTGKLVDLGPRPEKDADPVPQPPFKPFDEKDDHLEFFAVYEIKSGFFKGVRLPAYNMHYKFRESSKNPGFTTYNCGFDHPKATRARQLRDWMQVHKLEDDMIPWDDDSILPTLLERALESDVEVEINMAKGYIMRENGIVVSDGYAEANFGSDENVDGDELDSVEKAFPQKEEVQAPAKKSAKVEKPVAKKIGKKSKDEDSDDDL